MPAASSPMRVKAIRSTLRRSRPTTTRFPCPFEIDADGLGGDAQFEGHDLVAEVDLAVKEWLGPSGRRCRATRSSRSSTHRPALAKRSASSSVILHYARSKFWGKRAVGMVETSGRL
jgi:hypothetical protein